MSSLQSDSALATVKRDLSYMQQCIKQTIDTCDALELETVSRVKQELSNAKQRIEELENENLSLRTMLRNGDSRCHNVGTTESFQVQIDQLLLRAKLETEKLRERIKELEEVVVCLKEQVSIYKEDFEMERKDREHAQNVISDMQKQLKYFSGSSRTHNVSDPRMRHHYTHSPRFGGFDVCDNSIPSSTVDSTSTKTETDLDDNGQANEAAVKPPPAGEDDLGTDVCDVQQPDYEPDDFVLEGRGVSFEARYCTDGDWSNAGTPPLRKDGGQTRTIGKTNCNLPSSAVRPQCVAKTTLSCPKCWKAFSTEDHMLLLEHLEICD